MQLSGTDILLDETSFDITFPVTCVDPVATPFPSTTDRAVKAPSKINVIRTFLFIPYSLRRKLIWSAQARL
jgi:hypothetical protein